MPKVSSVKVGSLLRVASIALCASAVFVQPAQAQVGTQQRSFDIEAAPLSDAAVAFSAQAGVQLLLGSTSSEGVRAQAVQGRFTLAEALQRMLAGTGLTSRYVSAGVIAIERPGEAVDASDTGNKVFGTVEVAGAQNLDAGGFGKLDSFGPGAGANGSSDPTSTEGTGSYTTNGSVVSSRVPVPLQETTQSVTVMTQQRMEEQNLTDLNQVMDFTPGISVQTRTPHDQSYISRGFEIGSYSIDGGAPLTFSPYAEGSLDLAEYDRIEVLRGSAALFGSAGEPGGVISLIRKRPLNHEQFLFEAQGGSWNYYRVAVDATRPIAFDGRLRARLIGSALDRDFFFDSTHETRSKIFGSLEMDLWKNALVRGGGSYQKQDISAPNYNGLPRYANGDPLPLPRSTCFCAPFGFQNIAATEYFGAFEQRFLRTWTLKLDATYTKNDNKSLYTLVQATRTDQGGITPGQAVTGQFLGNNVRADNTFDNLGLSANLSGSFTLFGNEQSLALGAQSSRIRSKNDNSQYTFLGLFGQTFMLPVFGFDADMIPPPPQDPIVEFLFDGKNTYKSVYGLLNLQPLRGVHVNGGVRYTDVRTRNVNGATVYPPLTDTPSTAFQEPVRTRTDNWSPSLSVSYDLTRWLAAYGSFNDIFSPQNTNRFVPTDPADPSTSLTLPAARGQTYEAGLRVALRDGKLNGHLAYYDTRVNNRAVGVADVAAETIPGCCYIIAGRTISKGLDFELNGEIFEGFQLAASYNYNKNRSEGFPPGPPGSDITDAFNSLFPRHIVKFHASYDFLSGPLSGLTLSAGLRAESKRSIVDLRCTTFNAANRCTAQEYFPFSQPGYRVVDGLVNYRLNDNLELSANLYNIFDEKYFAQPSTTSGNNFYGQPRSFILTLRALVGDRYPGRPTRSEVQ